MYRLLVPCVCKHVLKQEVFRTVPVTGSSQRNEWQAQGRCQLLLAKCNGPGTHLRLHSTMTGRDCIDSKLQYLTSLITATAGRQPPAHRTTVNCSPEMPLQPTHASALTLTRWFVAPPPPHLSFQHTSCGSRCTKQSSVTPVSESRQLDNLPTASDLVPGR